MDICLEVKQQQILGVRRIPRIVVAHSCGHVLLKLRFDDEWQDCNITVLLTNSGAGTQATELLWKGVPLEIPAALLVSGELKISCVGLITDSRGKTRRRLTTKRMEEGIRIHAAAAQEGFAPGQELPGLWEQTLAEMGPLQNLQTANKTSLVAAINEALRSGGGGEAGVGIRSVEQTVTATKSGEVNEITVTLTDGRTQVLYIRNGAAGAAGKDGKDGSTPVKGVDYFTDAEIRSIVDQVVAQVGTGGAAVDLPNAMEVRF